MNQRFWSVWADVGVSLPLTGVPVLGPGHHQVLWRRVEAQAGVAASVRPAGVSALSHERLWRSLMEVVVTPGC